MCRPKIFIVALVLCRYFTFLFLTGPGPDLIIATHLLLLFLLVAVDVLLLKAFIGATSSKSLRLRRFKSDRDEM